MRRTRLPGLVALLIATCALLPPAAFADGDPASDVLVTQSFFVPQDASLTDAQRARLTGLLSAAELAHFPIRVAIVPAAVDLGAVTEFWLKPDAYARFLGVELSLIYTGPLLIVMPNGLGLSWPGHSTTAAEQLLGKIQIKPSGAGLLATVQAAVRALAASAGARVSGDTITAAKAGGSNDGLEVLVAAALAALVVISAVGFALRRSRQRDPGKPVTVSPRALVGWLGWVVPVLALLIALAVIVHALAHNTHLRVLHTHVVAENSPSVFPPHQRRAPSFVLRDQDGRPVSTAAYRGHPVIVTFIDPLSPEVDPRAAQILDEAERALPAPQRPEILAVSVNVDGDTHADLLRDLRQWNLVPQWRWVVGEPRQLATVWKRYYAIVDVMTKRIAGATVRHIAASKMAYLIDGKGYERALLGWPYGARELDRTLQSLERS